MIVAQRLITLSVGLSLLAAVACGGGGGNELEKALQSLSQDDLPIMVLPQEAFGETSDGLEVDPQSGVGDSEQAADDTIDPEDTGEDLEKAGFVTAYSLRYEDPTFAAFENGEGILDASSTVELFDDEEAASAHLAKQIEDSGRFEGEEVEPGVTLEAVEEFAVEGVAGDATGLVLHGRFGDSNFYATGVVFTVGRLRAGTGVTRADDSDVKAEAETLGRALAERIERVLLGEIEGTPVPIPEATEEAETEPPVSGPDLAKMALGLDDLPAGASIDREAFVADEDTLASYEREFDVGSTSIGGSQLVGLECDIDLYESALEASGVFAAIETIYGGERATEFFASFFEQGAGFAPSDVVVKQPDIPEIGDEAVAIHASTGTPVGTFKYVFIWVRVDRALGVLILTALEGEVLVEDAVPLAQAMAERMEAELAANP